MEDVAVRRDAVIAAHGPWTANNISLGNDVWTMGDPRAGAAEQRVARTAQLVADLAGGLNGLRVLDLGCYEGAFALELGAHGAVVHGVDVREGHIAKADFARDALGLTSVTFEVGDVRSARFDAGAYDAVLCLGLLYHLEAADAVALLERIAAATPRFTLIETQVALRGVTTRHVGGLRLRGRAYPEEVTMPGASVGNIESFWMTRSSLLNTLAAAGFTSVAECLAPVVPPLAQFRDHVTLAAWPSAALERCTLPPVGVSAQWPERVPWRSHPAQGRLHAAYDSVLRRRGKGLAELFIKR